MDQIELTDIDDSEWHKTVDQSKTPKPGALTPADFSAAIEATKSSAQAVPLPKYEQWMKEFGSM